MQIVGFPVLCAFAALPRAGIWAGAYAPAPALGDFRPALVGGFHPALVALPPATVPPATIWTALKLCTALAAGTNHSNTNVPEMKPPFRKPPVVAPSTPFLRDLLPTAKLPTNDPGHSALRACQCYNPSTTRKVQSSPR